MSNEVLSRFGVVSDEIHDDPAIAFAVAGELGMKYIDINAHWGKSVTDFSPDEVAEVKRLADENGLQTMLVAGPSFKSIVVKGMSPDQLLGDAEFEQHMFRLERSMEIAKELNAPMVRVFSFRWSHMAGFGNPSPRNPQGGEIPADELEAVVAGLRAACRLAERYDVNLGLENVRSCFGNSGRNTAEIVKAVDHPRLRVVWDPGNAYVSGEERPQTDGYQAVRPYVDHVHVKDARVVDPQTGLTAWECIDRGEVDYDEQFRALAQDGYHGVLVLETHWKPEGGTPEQASRESFAGLLAVRDRVLRERNGAGA